MKYSIEFILNLLQETKLINPYHMELVSDGHGEFPDGYRLTDEGVKRLIKELEEKLK